MATRSIIAKLDNKGVQAIYCHNDGYLSNNGKILDQHYADEDKVNELLAHGDVSTLDENIGEKINFGDIKLRAKNKQCMFYARDRGENIKSKQPIILEDDIALLEFADTACHAQYVYMYAFGAWYVYCMAEDNQFAELDDVLQKVYNSQSFRIILDEKIAEGNAQNIRRSQISFVYLWSK